MILFLTGQPGAGKTAYGLVRAKKFVDEGRLVYVHGVRGLKPDHFGFKTLEDPSKWQDLPDGSVVVIDECYSTFPTRAPGKAVPAHVEAMATHRHRGFDFVLIAQQGLQIDSFLRGLFEEHIHVRKKFGTRATKLKRWTHYQTNVNGPCADADDWIRPKWVFEGYESTVLDTTKVHIPRWLRLFAGTAVVFAIVCYALVHGFTGKIADAKAAATDAGGSLDGGGTTTGGGPRARPRTAQDYLALTTPRVEWIPASAPLYDGRPVRQVPKAYCIATQDACRCYTQQITPVTMQESACRSLANGGGDFDPYAEPPAEPSDRKEPGSSTVLSDDASTSHNRDLRPESGPPDPVSESRAGPGVMAAGTP